jgi:hypothetical protein
MSDIAMFWLLLLAQPAPHQQLLPRWQPPLLLLQPASCAQL